VRARLRPGAWAMCSLLLPHRPVRAEIAAAVGSTSTAATGGQRRRGSATSLPPELADALAGLADTKLLVATAIETVKRQTRKRWWRRVDGDHDGYVGFGGALFGDAMLVPIDALMDLQPRAHEAWAEPQDEWGNETDDEWPTDPAAMGGGADEPWRLLDVTGAEDAAPPFHVPSTPPRDGSGEEDGYAVPPAPQLQASHLMQLARDHVRAARARRVELSSDPMPDEAPREDVVAEDENIAQERRAAEAATSAARAFAKQQSTSYAALLETDLFKDPADATTVVLKYALPWEAFFDRCMAAVSAGLTIDDAATMSHPPVGARTPRAFHFRAPAGSRRGGPVGLASSPLASTGHRRRGSGAGVPLSTPTGLAGSPHGTANASVVGFHASVASLPSVTGLQRDSSLIATPLRSVVAASPTRRFHGQAPPGITGGDRDERNASHLPSGMPLLARGGAMPPAVSGVANLLRSQQATVPRHLGSHMSAEVPRYHPAGQTSPVHALGVIGVDLPTAIGASTLQRLSTPLLVTAAAPGAEVAGAIEVVQRESLVSRSLASRNHGGPLPSAFPSSPAAFPAPTAALPLSRIPRSPLTGDALAVEAAFAFIHGPTTHPNASQAAAAEPEHSDTHDRRGESGQGSRSVVSGTADGRASTAASVALERPAVATADHGAMGDDLWLTGSGVTARMTESVAPAGSSDTSMDVPRVRRTPGPLPGPYRRVSVAKPSAVPATLLEQADSLAAATAASQLRRERLLLQALLVSHGDAIPVVEPHNIVLDTVVVRGRPGDRMLVGWRYYRLRVRRNVEASHRTAAPSSGALATAAGNSGMPSPRQPTFHSLLDAALASPPPPPAGDVHQPTTAATLAPGTDGGGRVGRRVSAAGGVAQPTPGAVAGGRPLPPRQLSPLANRKPTRTPALLEPTVSLKLRLLSPGSVPEAPGRGVVVQDIREGRQSLQDTMTARAGAQALVLPYNPSERIVGGASGVGGGPMGSLAGGASLAAPSLGTLVGTASISSLPVGLVAGSDLASSDAGTVAASDGPPLPIVEVYLAGDRLPTRVDHDLAGREDSRTVARRQALQRMGRGHRSKLLAVQRTQLEQDEAEGVVRCALPPSHPSYKHLHAAGGSETEDGRSHHGLVYVDYFIGARVAVPMPDAGADGGEMAVAGSPAAAEVQRRVEFELVVSSSDPPPKPLHDRMVEIAFPDDLDPQIIMPSGGKSHEAVMGVLDAYARKFRRLLREYQAGAARVEVLGDEGKVRHPRQCTARCRITTFPLSHPSPIPCNRAWSARSPPQRQPWAVAPRGKSTCLAPPGRYLQTAVLRTGPGEWAAAGMWCWFPRKWSACPPSAH